MRIGIPQEIREDENRVAISYDVARLLKKSGFDFWVTRGAGLKAGLTNERLEEAGATLVADNASLYAESDVVLKVNPPLSTEVQLMRKGLVIISFLYAHTDQNLVRDLNSKNITSFAMDAVPRISRAQSMDALSSQANLAGYKAVILGANALGKIFPLLMTAAGSIKPSKVLIFGAGVAGLQAIATAKRLGAIVECTDIRPETKEQVESLGAKFLEIKGEGVKTDGGYAIEVSADYLAKQKELVSKHVAESDIVITTALVMGKKAPILVSKEMVKTMKPGSVIVDMAVEAGGNCELSEIGRTVVKENVTIIGERNLPSLVAVNASELYAKNAWALLSHLATKDEFIWDTEDEITKGCLITNNGKLVHEFTSQIFDAS